MKFSVDLNADLGEGSGHDAELFELISSANIATGFHAGDPSSMFDSIRAAKEKGVAVGAHPSFADRENFGRKELAIPIPELFAQLVYQLGAFQSVALAVGGPPNHVKPHGALYNLAVRNEEMAEAIAQAILAVDHSLILFLRRRIAPWSARRERQEWKLRAKFLRIGIT